MIKKYVHRKVVGSKDISVSEQNGAVGVGYMIIPSDVDRNEYISYVLTSKYCMMLDGSNQVHKDVKVASHVLNNLKFPEDTDSTGSAVVFVSNDSGEIYIVGHLSKPDEFDGFLENGVQFLNRSDEFSSVISMDVNSGVGVVSMTSSDSSGGSMTIKSTSPNNTSKVTVKDTGEIFIVADESLDININGNSIKLSAKEGIFTIESDKVVMNGNEAMVKGDTLKSLLTDLVSAIQNITVTAAGSPSSPPLNAATFVEIGSKLTNILSDKNFTG